MKVSRIDAPVSRVRDGNGAPLRADGDYVLYWMTAARRTKHSFALDRAVARAREFGRPLVILEALRAGYPWASDRLHRFVLDGMADNAARCAGTPAVYFPYAEPRPGAGSGLLDALAARACLVVADEYPCFFLPRMLAAAAARNPVRFEVVDSNGLLPLSASPAAFPTAYAFRRHLQRSLPEHLGEVPSADPLGGLPDRPARFAVPREIRARWPAASAALLAGDAALLARLPIDHGVPPAPLRGGAAAASAALETFVKSNLARYGQDRSHPDDDVASGLSPYLHFGHIGAHEVFARVARRERWAPARLAPTANGSRAGWWGMSPEAESFLDELITWRELGFAFNAHRPDYDVYDSLPPWARATLDEHAGDPRDPLYSLEDLEAARTHDPLWNAAQRQLRTQGRIQNYLRMLWGKKILEWSASPREACAAMIHLNNKYALDGRDPNSYSGIFWTLGRYDRPWAPERPIFGVIRYMSSTNTAKKLRVKKYLERWNPAAQANLF